MHKYPGGGYKEEHFYAEQVVEDFSFKDDFHYNKGSSGFHMKPDYHVEDSSFKDDFHYNKGSSGFHMKPDYHVEDSSFKDDFHYNKSSSGFHMKPGGHVEDFSFKDDFHYNKGSSGFPMKPGGHCSPEQPKHNYGDSLGKGHDGYTIQHREARIGKEQYTEPWSRRNEYSGGHGGKHHTNAYQYQSNPPHGHYGLMDGGHVGGGYGGHYIAGGGFGGHHAGGGFGGHREEKPYWNSKGIMD